MSDIGEEKVSNTSQRICRRVVAGLKQPDNWRARSNIVSMISNSA